MDHKLGAEGPRDGGLYLVAGFSDKGQAARLPANGLAGGFSFPGDGIKETDRVHLTLFVMGHRLLGVTSGVHQ